jgi:hypothetical protein
MKCASTGGGQCKLTPEWKETLMGRETMWCDFHRCQLSQAGGSWQRVQCAETAYSEESISLQGWIAVSEKAPPDFEDVLVLFPAGNCRYDIANWDSEAKLWSLPNHGFDHPDTDPTHWRPLPELPS